MPGHVGTCPSREPQTSPRGGPTSKLSNQEPTQSPHHPIRSWHGALGHQSLLSPCFLPYMGARRGYKTLPHSSYLADSLCFADPLGFLAHPPLGVLPESDRPIKGPDKRSIGVALSSHGISYSWHWALFWLHYHIIRLTLKQCSLNSNLLNTWVP